MRKYIKDAITNKYRTVGKTDNFEQNKLEINSITVQSFITKMTDVNSDKARESITENNRSIVTEELEGYKVKRILKLAEPEMVSRIIGRILALDATEDFPISNSYSTSISEELCRTLGTELDISHTLVRVKTRWATIVREVRVRMRADGFEKYLISAKDWTDQADRASGWTLTSDKEKIRDYLNKRSVATDNMHNAAEHNLNSFENLFPANNNEDNN